MIFKHCALLWSWNFGLIEKDFFSEFQFLSNFLRWFLVADILFFFFSYSAKCQRVPAMRCKIEKRTVVKTQPESKCSRVPRQYCRKEECSNDDDQKSLPPLNKDDPNCYYRNQIVSWNIWAKSKTKEKVEIHYQQRMHTGRRYDRGAAAYMCKSIEN